ncbi:MAG: efflux RND transporter periplasmic adaptor subunit [Chitinivibrionales bacterium]|nr:efflux RND transporter periplasmic adaptor subunit [Chitinivibrionales bacterium]
MAKKTMNILVVLMVAMMGIGFTGCKFKLPGKKTQSPNPQLMENRIKMNVVVDTARLQTLYQERKILGVLEAYREADCAPLQPGRVKTLPVKIGDYVKAGQVVATMDDAQLATTIAQFQSLRSQYERTKSLYEAHALSKAQFESVEAQYMVMKRQVESLSENTTIVAPFSGVVTARAVEEGELFSPPMASGAGQSRGLVRITQLDPLKIDCDVDDQTISYIKKGMHVRLSIDQLDTASVHGKVEWVNPQANAMSRTFKVRILVPNERQKLRPGYFAEVHIILAEKRGALTVGREAVVDKKVFVVIDNLAVARPVTVGWVTDQYIEITEGLKSGELVVVGGNKALPDSARIVIIAKSTDVK